MTDFLLWTVVLLTHSRNINGALAEGNVEYFFQSNKNTPQTLSTVLSEHFSFAKIIHAPDRSKMCSFITHQICLFFFFKSELLTVNDQSCFCFRKVVGFSHFVGYAGDVAFQPKAWKTQIHHLPLQAITSLNCGADNLFKNDVVYVAMQDTQKTLWNQIWVARASGLRHRSLCRDPIPIPDLNCILNCLQDWFGSDVQKQNKQKNNK